MNTRPVLCERASLSAFMNALWREWSPAKRLLAENDDLSGQDGVLHLPLTRPAGVLRVPLQYFSLSGQHRFDGTIHFAPACSPAFPIDFAQAVSLLTGEPTLAPDLDDHTRRRFLLRVLNSAATLLDADTAHHAPSWPDAGFLATEQGLVYGHAVHPAPKSRDEFTREDHIRYSPEFGGHTPLVWFAVQAGALWQARPGLSSLPDALIASDPGLPEMMDRYRRWVGVEKARLTAAINVGNRQQPSLETIAMLQPDLIVAVDFRHASLKALLERIAPTLMLSSGEREGLTAVFEDHRQLALALGLESRAALALTALDDCLARARNRLAAAGWAGKPLAILQHIAGVPQMWAFTGNSVPGGVQKALGLGGPWLHESARQGITVKTVEELLVLDVTLALLGGAPPQTAVWKQAPAVRHERLLVLPGGLWPFGGPVSTTRLVRALSAALLRLGHADRQK